MTTLIPKYDQGSTGAVNRAINLKLAESVSVEDFGAVGDGTTDNTTAFANAISAIYSNGGGTLLVPAGIWMVDYINLYSGVSVIGEGESVTIIRRRATSTTGAFMRVASGESFTTFQGSEISKFLLDGNNVGTNLTGLDLLNVDGGTKNFLVGTAFVLKDIQAYQCSGIGVEIGFNAGSMTNMWALGCKQGFYIYGVAGYAYMLSSAGSTDEEIIIDCDGFNGYGIETEWVSVGTNNAAKNVINIINQGKVSLYGVSNTGGTLVRNAIVGTNGNPDIQVFNIVKRSANPTYTIDDNGTMYSEPVIGYFTNAPTYQTSPTLGVTYATSVAFAKQTTSVPTGTPTPIYTVSLENVGLFIAYDSSGNGNVFSMAYLGNSAGNVGFSVVTSNALTLTQSSGVISAQHALGSNQNITSMFLRLA
jgi:hypothetical protein